ncbi:helix-turn-helix domain-containing protein [Rhizobium leguminosarum]|uniref:GlxA family transcriptional regulator n=1 Tax=Rhizobium ruizarguesonis TaxID=2081791 RepID=UPI0013DFA239|nr:GlxA family transcriptional regulator [Rhizobium ruizarguesonis]NEJ84560.1 helix-turn-helix domain-containing protein [Rhizobium ruizarguesonis]
MRIAILAMPGVQMLDVAGPMDVFSEANKLINGRSGYELSVVGCNSEPVVASNGGRLLPDLTIREPLDGFDTLIIAGSPSVQDFEADLALIEWVRSESAHVRRLASICTGAFLLGSAGLLNGRRATTHWNSTTRLRKMFPAIDVQPNTIFIKDGTVYTSAGVTASMDLALALVEEDFGRGVALRVAKELILFLQRPGGQSQFSVHLEAQVSELGPIRDVIQWIAENIADDLTVATLASRLGMSARNFARTFKRETGMTPGDYVDAVRVDTTRRMLEEGDVPLKRVAALCGFNDQSAFRRAFIRRINVTPVEYRSRFRRGAKHAPKEIAAALGA